MKILIAVLILLVLLFLAFFLVRFAKKKPVKPLKIVLSGALAVLWMFAFLLTAAVLKNLTDGKLSKISRDWECAESLVEDKDTYTGYLCLEINETGRFSMYDGEAGNPAIEGFLTRVGKNKLLMICTNFSEFDPPSGWWDMDMTEQIIFELDSSEDALLLRYEDENGTATLKFYEY